jgi:hypothetical protein
VGVRLEAATVVVVTMGALTVRLKVAVAEAALVSVAVTV